ncbi:General transcription factor II-I repeat domain-containing protein 2 [Merluccius polli]|uniref:General transcription factor II-I repeat domain-containing protein 2 n=1 Tax=Merluccius polli TaxID=89951 RepID=A0AA47MTZ0_MERPO|nr:General transcription factor II-I repeat domain-containing protein 2 [Merluccius polli]
MKHENTFKDQADKTESMKRAVSRYGKQASSLKVFATAKDHGTEASYRIAHCIAKHGKPYTDATYRVQQTAGLKNAAVFSIALDESVDVNDIPRLAVMARYCDSTVREELCCLKPMPDTTKGEDIARALIEHFEERGINMDKVFAVTTDGAPAMVGRQKGAVKLIEEKVGHPIMKLHCIIHQENLCAKMSNSDLNEVMATVAKIINFIVKRSALTHRQFQALLEELDSAYTDLPLHTAVRWLSCGKVLERFVSCFDAVKAFLSEKGQNYPELEDEKWIVKLVFLADITGHLNGLNLRLQGAGQTVLDMFETWTAFVGKLAVFSDDISTSTFRYFRHLRELSSHRNIRTAEITTYMHELEAEFKTRFDMEMQLIELKSSSLWVTKFAELRKQLESSPVQDHGAHVLTCWASTPEKFSCLRDIALPLLSVFGSTYLCEQVFSHMKHVLSPTRSRLTTEHSEACLQLKVTNYMPQITELSQAKQGQGSH